MRWAHPVRGLVPPLEFIPLAERTGLIIPLGEWVLREACRQARIWQLARPNQPPLMMSVNLSGVQLRHPGLVATVSLALEDSGLPPELLTLEITESVLAHESDEVTRRLRQLKGLGVCLAIDDFGTGYSSLSYLRRFPIDLVKIDKTFVDGIAAGSSEAALARAIVKLAHSLKIKTVAEGVELEGQARGLSRMGSDQAQGFYFAKPMDAEAATAHHRRAHDAQHVGGSLGPRARGHQVRHRRLRGGQPRPPGGADRRGLGRSDHGRPGRGHGPQRRVLVRVRQLRGLLLGRRPHRPRAVHGPRPDRRNAADRRDAHVHPPEWQALGPADARRHVWPVHEQPDARGGRSGRTARARPTSWPTSPDGSRSASPTGRSTSWASTR